MSVQRRKLSPADEPRSTARSGIGRIVLASMAAGLVLAVVVVVLPVVPAEERALTGGVLLAFAAGWGLLAVLSARFSDQPQGWAAAPAACMGLTGLAALSGSAAVHRVLDWVWPPVLLVLVAWTFFRARRQLRSRSRGWVVIYPVLAVLGTAAVGGGYETVRESLDAEAYPPPGQLVDVGGHRLHLQCTGSGSPTVVLEPGHGGAAADIAWVSSAVARTTRVCVYDRAGRGWSDPADGPQDAARIAADLHTLLDRGGVPGPYVLAGHSFGGLYVLSFAAQFPDDVAGMVLLDSTAPTPGPARPADAESSAVGRIFALVPAVAHLGIERLLVHGAYDGLPPEVQNSARANGSTAQDLHSSLQEFLHGSASMQQAAALTGLGAEPLIVLTADTGSDASWQTAQQRLVTLSTNSVHRHAQATHQSLVGDQAHAATASQAVLDVVEAFRTSRPLAR